MSLVCTEITDGATVTLTEGARPNALALAMSAERVAVLDASER
jgi:hypothetical protein